MRVRVWGRGSQSITPANGHTCVTGTPWHPAQILRALASRLEVSWRRDCWYISLLIGGKLPEPPSQTSLPFPTSLKSRGWICSAPRIGQGTQGRAALPCPGPCCRTQHNVRVIIGLQIIQETDQKGRYGMPGSGLAWKERGAIQTQGGELPVSS